MILMYRIAAIGNLPHIRALALVGVEWFDEEEVSPSDIRGIISDKSYAILIVSEQVYLKYKHILDNIKRPEFSVVILGRDEEKASDILERKIERALGTRIFEHGRGG